MPLPLLQPRPLFPSIIPWLLDASCLLSSSSWEPLCYIQSGLKNAVKLQKISSFFTIASCRMLKPAPCKSHCWVSLPYWHELISLNHIICSFCLQFISRSRTAHKDFLLSWNFTLVRSCLEGASSFVGVKKRPLFNDITGINNYSFSSGIWHVCEMKHSNALFHVYFVFLLYHLLLFIIDLRKSYQ